MRPLLKEHKNHLKTFRELDYLEQVRSLTATISLYLPAAIKAHLQIVEKEKGADKRKLRKEALKKQIGKLITTIGKM